MVSERGSLYKFQTRTILCVAQERVLMHGMYKDSRQENTPRQWVFLGAKNDKRKFVTHCVYGRFEM